MISHPPHASSRLRRGKENHAFSLTELIIAMALIATLAVLSMGAYQRMGDAGRNASCMGQMKQIYTSLMAYTQDYRGMLPPATDPGTRSYTWDVPWRGLWCNPILGEEVGFPAYSGGIKATRRLMICPENLKETPQYETYDGFKHHYLCNYELMTSRGHTIAPARLWEIQLPNTVLLMDAAVGDLWKGAGVPAKSFGTEAWTRIGKRHRGNVNILWADGHVTQTPLEALTREDFERKPR